ncbi:uncharacterized protein KD926_005704 [Aspergillus affinis]|uniref:uncharacterized protein n=1 Tax=Aspergillus affinis TaxID=1070780 RepID=UPI0022FE4594|nr:uncharacterized protein KD926_005704 [Aspergillus affinis]KAI9034755.1 hypothetical protein KD926_005704 [Aspergillus affinis]
MPVLEGTHLLESEADVLRLTTLQLLHPVNIALDQIRPPKTHIFCRTESSIGNTSRFDVEWSLRGANGTRLCRLAILEVKNTNVIHKDDFKSAAASDEKDFQSKMYRAVSLKQSTFLRENGVWLSKQARKYSKSCPCVAVFNWNAMFIFSFIRQAQVPVRGIYFDETGRTGDMTFR